MHWIAARIHEKLPLGVELDDVISAGIASLFSAVDNFDASHNEENPGKRKIGTESYYKEELSLREIASIMDVHITPCRSCERKTFCVCDRIGNVTGQEARETLFSVTALD